MTVTHPGELEQLILFAVLRLRGEAYGVRIREEIARRTGRSVSAGGIYTILGRLEARGLVTSRLSDETPERGGRRKKMYRITADGAEALRASYEALQAMARDLLPELRAATSEEG